MSIPPLMGCSGASSGPRWAGVNQEVFLSSGVQGAAPLGLPPPLGERGGHPITATEIRPNHKLRVSTEQKILYSL